ncbi:MAG: hypothetical protein IPF52_15100 [Saprospiraceae bacterium]|nr:hypothetical protein [Saprospiraceae bacterium]
MYENEKYGTPQAFGKKAGSVLNEAFPLRRDKSCFYQSLCLVDSEVLLHRHYVKPQTVMHQAKKQLVTNKITVNK